MDIQLTPQLRNLPPLTLTDLPKELLIEIFSWLPVQSVFSSRCVSKTWYFLLSSSNIQFTKLYFQRSPTQLICQVPSIPTFHFHFVEINNNHKGDAFGVKVCPLKYELIAGCTLVALNSCRGFLLLATDVYSCNPTVLCNPFTREYVTLPIGDMDYKISIRVVSGFGFCAESKKFKVVRLVYRGKGNARAGSRRLQLPENRMAEVYTIGGADSWRVIGPAPKYPEQSFPSFSTYFNGVMHWVCDKNGPDYIVTFDFESECFGTLPPPPIFVIEPVLDRTKMMIGVLGGCLCLSNNLELWVMKKYGVQDSWTKVYAIDVLPHGSHQVLKSLGQGKVLIKYREDHHFDDRIISYNPVENNCKEFEEVSDLWSFSAIPHTPNFMTFTDALKGE
ncbi:hypothetical protein ACFE04_013785 [Oxalis oulophora]